MSYTNSDGLYVLTFGDQGKVNDTGTAIETVRYTYVQDLDLTKLGTTFGAANINPMNAVIPAGAVITNAFIKMTTAATSAGSATLTIGTYNAAGTAVDADGIDAAIALTAIDAALDVVRCDGAQVGGVLTVGAAPVYVGAVYGTAAFTAGTGKLVIEYVLV